MAIMRLARLLVLLACVSTLCRAQTSLQAVMDGTGSDTEGTVLFTQLRPSITTVVREYGAHSANRPTVLFDSSLQNWMDQQMEVLDTLQNMFVPHSPCGQARAALALDPSIMATSRFGPALLTTMLQQMELDTDDEEVEDTQEGSWDPLFASQDDEAPVWDPLEEDTFAIFRSDAEVAQPAARQEDNSRRLRRSDPVGLEMLSKNFNKGGSPPHSPPPRGRPMACGMSLFIVLSVACGLVWGTLLRMYLSCARSIKQDKARRATATTANPLLEPLVREDGMDANMAYARDAVPQGAYYVPSGAQYVRVAYTPLHCEE